MDECIHSLDLCYITRSEPFNAFTPILTIENMLFSNILVYVNCEKYITRIMRYEQ